MTVDPFEIEATEPEHSELKDVPVSFVPPTPEEEVENLTKALNEEIRHAKKRDEIVGALLRRKAEAEKTIKELSEKRLNKAYKAGLDKSIQVLVEDFAIGGFSKIGLKDGKSSNNKLLAIGRRGKAHPSSTLFLAPDILAVREESIPGFPAFVLSNDDSTELKKKILTKLKAHLTKLCQPYIVVSEATMKKIIEES